MLRKLSIQALAFLLVALPLLGVFARDTQAADSSRVAIISALSGDVQVQKSGGSKKLKAFKKLNLNQGDMLYTGSDGSATLQFSNGTSSDDTMTVAANTTLKFSKLTSGGSTVTKVSMLKGSAWSDVKSIKNKDDQFQVETPTAIMGVRGTNFLVFVSPVSGSTTTSVFAGVVQMAPSKNSGGFVPTQPGTIISESTPGSVFIYPTNQIIIGSGSKTEELDNQITIIDLDTIANHISPDILLAILESKKKIDEENKQMLEAIKASALPAQLGTDLDVVGANFENLIGALINQISNSGTISKDKLDEILKKAQDLLGQFVEYKDKYLNMTAKDKEKIEELKKKEEEAAKLALEKKQKQLAEQLEKEKLEKEKKLQDAANAAKLEQLKKELEEKLNPSKPNQTTPNQNPSSDAKLSALSLSDGVLSPSFSPDTASYTVNVSNDVAVLTVSPTAASTASLKVNGNAVANGAGTVVPLSLGANTITVAVTAQDGTTTKTYSLNVNRALISQIGLSFGNGSLAINPDQDEYDLGQFTNEDSSFTLTLPNDGTEYTVDLNGEEVLPAALRLVSIEVPDWEAPLTYYIQLEPGDNEIKLKTSLNGYERTYTFNAYLDDGAQPSNHPPVASDQQVSVGSGESLTINLAATDSDGDELTFEIVEEPANGTLEHMEDVSYSYVPDEGFTGVDSFTYRAYDGSEYSETANVSIVVTGSNNASLVDILVAGESLEGFVSGTFRYEVSVPYGTTTLAVEGIAEDESAAVEIEGNTGLSQEGENEITITVTAADGVTKQIYTIEVAWLAANSDAYLSGLSVSEGTLSPSFSPTTYEYNVKVSNGTSKLLVTAVSATSTSAIDIAGGPAQSGLPKTIDLNAEGETEILITVTAQNGQAKLYLIKVQRLSSVASLSDLSVVGYELNPIEGNSSNVRIPGSVNSLTLNYQASENASVVVRVNDEEDPSGNVVSLDEGDNVIWIEVTSEDGTNSDSYTIFVKRISSDSKLSELNVSGFALSPQFSPNEENYSILVPNSAVGVMVEYWLSDEFSNASLQVNGNVVEGPSVELDEGDDNVIEIVVTAEDDSSTTYKITVNRQAPLPEGVLNWTTTANESEVNWTLVGEPYSNEYLEKRDYVIYFETAPQSFEVEFGFDRTHVTAAELDAFDDYTDLFEQSSFSIEHDQWHDGANEAVVYIYLTDEREVRLNLTVYIGAPKLSLLSLDMDDGTVSAPRPVNTSGTELSAVAYPLNENDRLNIRVDSNFGYGNLQVVLNDVELTDGDGYYADLEDGWNEILFNLLDPVTRETIVTYTLQVYSGSEIQSELLMTNVSGTYEGETTMDVLFVPSEEDALTFSGWLAPYAASEMILTPSVADSDSLYGVLYWNQNGQLEWAEQASFEGSFILPLYSVYDSAYVVLKDELGHSVAYEVGLEQPPYAYLSMKYEISSGSYMASYPINFGSTYWNVWTENSGATKVYLEQEWESGYTYEIDGVPIEEFDFAPGGTPIPEGDNVYELTVSDESGRSAAYEFHLIREGNWTSNVTVTDLVVQYGNNETARSSLGTYGSSSWSKNWIVYLPAHTNDVSLSFQLAEGSTSALYDFTGKLLEEGTTDYSISMNPLQTEAGYTIPYYLVTKDSAGNRYLYPIILNFEETEEPSNGLPNGIVDWSLTDANDIAHSWTATSDVAYYTTLNEETTSLAFHLDLEEGYSVSLASVENGYLEMDPNGNYSLALLPGYNEYYLYVTAPSEYTEEIYLYAIVGDVTPELVASFNTEEEQNAADIYSNGYMYWRPMDAVTEDTIQLAAFNFDTARVYLDELYDDFDFQSIDPTSEGAYPLELNRNINRYTLYMSDVAGRTFQPIITIFYKLYERLNPEFEAGDGIVISPYDSVSRSWTAHIDLATQSGEHQLNLNFADEGYYALSANLSDPTNSGIIKTGENGTYTLDFSSVSETVVNLKIAITYASGDLEEYTLTLDFTPTA